MAVDAASPTAFTVRLRALGQLELTATSGDASAVLSQRKRVALLAYLAFAGPRAPCGREMLATLFWPDSPADAARHSLREALRLLRRALGADLIVTRAGDDLGVDPALMWTDVAEFERAIAAGRNDDAMAIYRGPLLEGLTLREASSEFEHWLDGERARLHAMAVRAASAITDDAERAGNVTLAARAARDCVRLAPFDEVLFRRLLVLLERAGDSAGALHAYEAFAERLARELEVAPSRETQAIVARLRAGTAGPTQPIPDPPNAEPAVATPRAPDAVVAPVANTRGPAPSDAPTTVSAMESRDQLAMLRKALGLYAVAFVAVVILARAAILSIGLPDWVFPGALIVMGLGLPVILFTGYVRYVARHVLAARLTYAQGGATSVPHGSIETLVMKANPHVSWRRAAQGGIYALSGFVLFVGAFMALRALGIGPFGSLLAAGKIRRRDPVLITDFRITNVDSALGRVASDAVRLGLAESSAIKLVAPATVLGALVRDQRPVSSTLDLTLARELASREGVNAIIDGELARVGTDYIVTLRLVTADSATLLTTATATGNGPQGFIDAVDKATRALRAKVGESLRGVHQTPPLAQVTTGSLEALRKYSEAYRANNAGDYATAIKHGREAVAIDSNFAFAWRIIGTVMWNVQANWNLRVLRAAQDSAFERAYRLRDRLSERERLWITGQYYGQGPGRDRAKAAAAYEALMVAGDTAVAANQLGTIYSSLREFDQADSMYSRAQRADPTMNFPWSNRAMGLMGSGRLAAAESTLEYRKQLHPPDVVVASRTVLSYHRGKIDEYRRGVDSLQTSRDSRTRNWALLRKSELALRDGRWDESKRLFTEARAVESAAGISSNAVADSAALATFEVIMRGRDPRIVARLDSTLAHIPLRTLGEVDRPYFALASFYAIAGRPDKAESLITRYDAEITDTALKRAQRPGYSTAVGEIALAEGRTRDAIAAFRKGDSLPDGPANECTICLPALLGRAFDAAHEPDSAIAQYEAYLTKPFAHRFFAPYDPSLLPGVHRRLGELYEAKGDESKALDHYQQFVDIWHNADPELRPQVDDVRRRIARLRAALRPKG